MKSVVMEFLNPPKKEQENDNIIIEKIERLYSIVPAFPKISPITIKFAKISLINLMVIIKENENFP